MLTLALFVGVGLGAAITGLASAGEPIQPKTERQGSSPAPKEPVQPVTEAKSSMPAPTTAQAMWCRGPFLLKTGRTVLVAGNKAPVAAGQDGLALKPGECALEGRALSSGEPRRVRFNFGSNDHGYAANVTPALAVCALDRDCVVAIDVRADLPRSQWVAVPNVAITILGRPTG